jgi:hypothetical protein
MRSWVDQMELVLSNLDNESFRITLRLTISQSILISSPVYVSEPDFSVRLVFTYLSLSDVLSSYVKNLSFSVAHLHNTYDFMFVHYTWPVQCELS